MKLSLIIPVYNTEAYLRECLLSCTEQDLEDYEIIVIIDGSPDNSLDIAREFAADYDNITVISQPNAGLSEARNAGMRKARGKYIMFVDSDDRIREQSLKPLVERCIDENLDMLLFCAADITGDEAVRRFSYPENAPVFAGRTMLDRKFQVCAPFAIYRKGMLEDHHISFFPGIFHEDNDFTPRVYYHSQRTGMTDEVIYLVRQTPGSITRSINPQKSYDSIKVMERLALFAENEVCEEFRGGIYSQAGHCFNWSLHEMYLMQKSDAKAFAGFLKGRKDLFGMLRRSSWRQHRSEGMLLSLCPRAGIMLLGFLNGVNVGGKIRKTVRRLKK